MNLVDTVPLSIFDRFKPFIDDTHIVFLLVTLAMNAVIHA